MNRKIAVIAALALLSGPAFAQSVGEKTGINSALGISPTTADFVKEAAVSDMFEIQSSKMAVEKSDEPTKAFARQMIADHTKTSAELTAMLSGDPATPIPAAVDASHQSKLDKLAGLNGTDFTKQYHDMQVAAHKDAVSLFQRYANGGDSQKLKGWAATTLPTIQRHLDMARALDK